MKNNRKRGELRFKAATNVVAIAMSMSCSWEAKRMSLHFIYKLRPTKQKKANIRHNYLKYNNCKLIDVDHKLSLQYSESRAS